MCARSRLDPATFDRWGRRALALAVVAFAAHAALGPMEETDLFFHLKIGQIILATHHIPFRNLFSFTYPDHLDPDLAWGFQVLVAILFRAGGFAAIVLAKTALVAAAAALVHRAARRSGAGPVAAAAATTLAVLAAGQRLCERPHLVTFVGIGAAGLLLAEWERGRRRALWLFVPLCLLWAQFHAGVFFGPLLLALASLGAAAGGQIDRRQGLACGAILGLSAAAAFATPAGRLLLGYLRWHAGVGETRNIEEFRQVELASDPWFFTLGALAALGLLALLLRRERRLRLALPALVLAPLAAHRVRFVAEWAFLTAPFCAVGLSALGRGLSARLERAGIALPAAAALGLLGLVTAARWGRPLELGVPASLVPRAAIDFVTREGLRERLYHDLDLGCYLLWEGWPRYRVFQDARLPAYPVEYHRALDDTSLDGAAWDAFLRRFGVDAALLNLPDINMRAGSFDPETWALVYRSKDALVFARRSAAHDGLIARTEIPLRVRFRFRGGSWVEPLPAPPARSPVAACEWDRRLAAALDAEANPDGALEARARALGRGCLAPAEEADVHFRLGARLQLAGSLAGARAAYDRVLALDPGRVDALVNRGLARLPADPAGARADLERALALDPSRADAREGLRRLGR